MPPYTESSALCGLYMEMPAAEQRKRDAWIGLDNVMEQRGLKMGGWYAMIMDAGSESASSATRVVRLSR